MLEAAKACFSPCRSPRSGLDTPIQSKSLGEQVGSLSWRTRTKGSGLMQGGSDASGSGGPSHSAKLLSDQKLF